MLTFHPYHDYSSWRCHHERRRKIKTLSGNQNYVALFSPVQIIRGRWIVQLRTARNFILGRKNTDKLQHRIQPRSCLPSQLPPRRNQSIRSRTHERDNTPQILRRSFVPLLKRSRRRRRGNRRRNYSSYDYGMGGGLAQRMGGVQTFRDMAGKTVEWSISSRTLHSLIRRKSEARRSLSRNGSRITKANGSHGSKSESFTTKTKSYSARPANVQTATTLRKEHWESHSSRLMTCSGQKARPESKSSQTAFQR